MFRCIALSLLITASLPALATAPGESLQEFTLKNQHDAEAKVDKTIKYLVFAKDKKGSQIVEKAFKEVDKTYFAKKNMLYVADVSGMPGFALSWFAKPKMKKYPFQVLLDEEPGPTKDFPSKKDQVSLLYLDQLNMTKVEYFDSAESLSTAAAELD